MSYELLKKKSTSGGGGSHLIGDYVTTTRIIDGNGNHYLPMRYTFSAGRYPDFDAEANAGNIQFGGSLGINSISGLKAKLYTKVAGAPDWPYDGSGDTSMKRYTDGINFHGALYPGAGRGINCIYTEDNGLTWSYKSVTLPVSIAGASWDWNPKTKEIVCIDNGSNGFSTDSLVNKRVDMHVSVDDGVSFSSTTLDFNDSGNAGIISTMLFSDFRSDAANYAKGVGAAIHQDGIAAGAFVAVSIVIKTPSDSVNPLVIKSFTDPSDPMSTGALAYTYQAAPLTRKLPYVQIPSILHWCALSKNLLQISRSAVNEPSIAFTSGIFNMDGITNGGPVGGSRVKEGTIIPSPYGPGKYCCAVWKPTSTTDRYNTDVALPTVPATVDSLLNPGNTSIVIPSLIKNAGLGYYQWFIPSKTETDLLGVGVGNIASLSRFHIHSGASIIDTDNAKVDPSGYGIGPVAPGAISALNLLPTHGDDTHFFYVDRSNGTVSKIPYGDNTMTDVGYTLKSLGTHLPNARYCVGRSI